MRLTRVFEGRRLVGCIHWVLVEHLIRPDVGDKVASQMRSSSCRWRCGGRGRSLANAGCDSYTWDGRRAPPGHKHVKGEFFMNSRHWKKSPKSKKIFDSEQSKRACVYVCMYVWMY